MFIFLYGPDTFRSRRQLKKMIEKFKTERDPQGLNVVILDCEKIEPGEIMEQILASPFLAEKRMIVLENLLSAAKKDGLQEEILKRIEEKKLPDSTVYVFWENWSKTKTNTAKKLFNRLYKEKFAQKFETYTGAKLTAWTAEEIKNQGGKISRTALDYLTQNTGADMWRLNSLIAQLINYRQGKEIQIADINLFIEEKVDDNIFNLVDAIVARQTKQVYQMIQEQYRLGKDSSYVFSMILRQFRILLEMRDLFEREDSVSSDILAKKLELHPYVVKKSLPFVKKYTMIDLKCIYQELLNLDINTKTGQGDQSLLLDVFVSKVTA